MLNKIIHFLKYNNATIVILALILILGTGALAAGPEAIGQRQTNVKNTDNTLLLSADLNNFNMDFKIENISQDENYYYATYSYLDLVVLDNAWQYQLNSKTRKISKKIRQDIGEYMAKFLAKQYEARVRELKQEKTLAEAQGEQKRIEVTAYSGLIGRTLDLAAKVFPGYEPVIKKELPSPENFNLEENIPNPNPPTGQADNLTQIYNDYVAAHPEVFDLPPSEATSTPAQTQTASSTPDSGIPALPEPGSVSIIELPSRELTATGTTANY